MNQMKGSLEQQKIEIAARLDWLLDEKTGAGFDFVNTESGTTEFSHPKCHPKIDIGYLCLHLLIYMYIYYMSEGE